MDTSSYIWTKHALLRLKERKIHQTYIDQVLQNPDRSRSRDDGALELQKRIDQRTFAAIVKPADTGEKLIISCWVNPAYPGTKDERQHNRYRQMQKASFMKKLWLTVLNQLGL